MDLNPGITSRGIFSRIGMRMMKKRSVIIGLKPDNCSREMLLRLLTFVVERGDSVLALHVHKSEDALDPNTFHIHEDICKSKKVDFEVKICAGDCHITELTHQVRVSFATILVIGGGDPRPKDSTINRFLKALPPSCTLLVMDNGGKILFQKMGTSQQGSGNRVLRSFMSSPTPISYCGNQSETCKPLIKKLVSLPCSLVYDESPSSAQIDRTRTHIHNQFPIKISHRVTMLELKGQIRRFSLEELNRATNCFFLSSLIEEGDYGQLYQATLDNDLEAVVKVLKAPQLHDEDICKEVEMMSGLRHENIAKILGYCCRREISAIVYNLPHSTLKQRLKNLVWNERIDVAIGLAKALDHLHSCHPPIIHRDIKPSNIFLSADCKPQLSNFGAAAILDLQSTEEPISVSEMPILGTGTFGYLAPEYTMYGKVNEKIDVYSYGVVILELITGREAISTSSKHNGECSVVWARSILNCGLSDRLIDPNLHHDYDEDEMKILMVVIRLCLLHSSSRRPTMREILRLLEEPGRYWSHMRRTIDDDHVRRTGGCNYERRIDTHSSNSDPNDNFLLKDDV